MKAGRGPVPFYWILEQCHCTLSFSITFNIYNFPHLLDKQKPGRVIAQYTHILSSDWLFKLSLGWFPN